MALLHRCDRCGALIEWNHAMSNVRLTSVSPTGRTAEWEPQNLCVRCAAALQKWLQATNAVAVTKDVENGRVIGLIAQTKETASNGIAGQSSATHEEG